jgi:hypothetical protein
MDQTINETSAICPHPIWTKSGLEKRREEKRREEIYKH